MNWTEVADGAWPDNEAFAQLSDEARLAEIHSAIRLASSLQSQTPQSTYRLASAALHARLHEVHEVVGDGGVIEMDRTHRGDSSSR